MFDYFTPVAGLIGGVLIGLAAATLLLFNGDVLGASGLMSSFVVSPRATLTGPEQQWKLWFVLALFGATRIYLLVDPTALDDARTWTDPAVPVVSSAGYLLGGFLVGFGTRLGNGCTTGHGICGMARLSLRSTAGVLSFMSSGVLLASVLPPDDKTFRCHTEEVYDQMNEATPATNGAVFGIAAVVAAFSLYGLLPRKRPKRSAEEGAAAERDEDETTRSDNNNRNKIYAAVAAGILFAVGLIASGMVIYSKLFGFLDVTLIPKGTWDPTLVLVMGGGVAASFASYQFVDGFNAIKNEHKLSCPISQSPPQGKFCIPTNKTIDLKLIAGELIFGLGWGMAGLCPGPAIVRAASGSPAALTRWWPMFFLGALVAEQVKNPPARFQSPARLEVASDSKILAKKESDSTIKTKTSGDEELAGDVEDSGMRPRAGNV